MVRGTRAGVPGPAAGRAGTRDLPEAAQGKTRGAQRGGEAEDLGRAGRQVRPVRLRADGVPGYPKVSLAAILDLGVCRWDHIVLGISARSHVDAATLRRALERTHAACSKGEEHMAKLSVNAIIGLCARSTEVVYSVRSSSSKLDGAGADFSQAFAYEGGMADLRGAERQREVPLLGNFRLDS